MDASAVSCANGGNVIITFGITDDCGNTYADETCMIPVNFVDLPVFDCTTLPTLDCEDALNIQNIPTITFSNNLTGACEIIATAAPSSITASNLLCDGSGTITVSFNLSDDCNNIYAPQTCVLNVNAAPLPIFSCPTLPAVDCDAALSLGTADIADIIFDNSLTGDCMITATASATAIDDSGVLCDGTGVLMVTYGITDPCGSTYAAEACMITVNPAPAPAFTCPTYPAIDCDAALALTTADIADVSFTNGLTGACLVSGMATAISVDASSISCSAGGNVLITFSLSDDCGNTYANETCMMPVNFATLPILDCNTIAAINCVDAQDISTIPSFTFSNNLTGVCEVIATATAIAVNTAGLTCDGNGNVEVTYEITDDCGNTYADVPCTVPVLAAPPPAFTCPTLTVDCDAAVNLTIADISDVTFDNGLIGGCLVTATADAASVDVSGCLLYTSPSPRDRG